MSSASSGIEISDSESTSMKSSSFRGAMVRHDLNKLEARSDC
jgi:hypothetical protein